jgi:phospholipase/carboxylesterase
MNKVFPDAIEIEPSKPARGTVIWLHGLGADGQDFEPLVRQWDLGERLGLRFVLPHAPVRRVTLNAGMAMRAWYDIAGLDMTAREDAAGVRASQQAIEDLIREEHDARGIDAASILLAGFSQGGAMALHTGLRFPQPLAGILGLSCYLPLASTLGNEMRACQRDTAIRMDHGIMDPVVPLKLAERSRDLLLASGFNVEFNHYAMGHSLCPQQVDSLYRWIERRFAE